MRRCSLIGCAAACALVAGAVLTTPIRASGTTPGFEPMGVNCGRVVDQTNMHMPSMGVLDYGHTCMWPVGIHITVGWVLGMAAFGLAGWATMPPLPRRHGHLPDAGHE